MSEEKSNVGRPRLYTSASEKVSAFRSRQQSEGYVRKEILVDEKTWEVVSQLAREHKVSASDAGAGLLEYGLAQFKSSSITGMAASTQGYKSDALLLNERSLVSKSSPIAQMLSASETASGSVLRSLGNAADTTPSSDTDLIRDFFNKRKKAQNNDIQS